MNLNENIDLENPGLSPSDRVTLQQLRKQTPQRSSSEATLLEIAPRLDPLATRFLRDTKRKTFAGVTDSELSTWLQSEWSREPDEGKHAKKCQRLNKLWRAATDVEILCDPMSREPAGTLGIPASLAEAKRKYREVANGGCDANES